MKDKFTKIEQRTQSNDPELLHVIAMLNFISKDYQTAREYFERIIQQDPNNYFVMNKIGAMHALLKRQDLAREMYHKTLDMKPNYVRGWVNLGINYKISLEFNKSIYFFLNALSLNP